jgi:phosphoenolpyruvate phosphomutase
MTLNHRILAEDRRGLLKAMLADGRKLRAIEAHNPLSGLIGSEAGIDGPGGARKEFDALWLSGFTCASSRALPDVELARQEKKLETIEEIAAATDKPLIADADTGGDALAFRYLCTRLEALGVSLIIVEDKVFPKRTSLAAGVHHGLEDPAAFADKIAQGREAMLSGDVLVFARIESLIAGAGPDDALARARVYLESPADGIVIHSKDKSGEEIFAFIDGFNALRRETGIDKPLLCIPTAYNFVSRRPTTSSPTKSCSHAACRS